MNGSPTRIAAAVERETRRRIVYGDAGVPTGPRADGYQTTQPTEGYYRMRLRMGGIMVGIHVWYGPPHDPVTGDELDRSWRWQATANGEPIDLERVWPMCGRDPIDEAEHDHLRRLQAFGREHAPDSALADPRQPINHLTAPVTF